jgi:ribonucleoside-diphosphate reductase alpha chain
MRVFDCATENIRQGGRRRGANMGVLRADHPDVLDFIRAKVDGSGLTNFNLSLGVSDAFMRAALEGGRCELVHPATGRVAGRIAAGEVLDAAVDAAWRSGDPGLVFLDAVNRANPTPALGTIETTNPCGEVPLLPHESCVLGSINLARLVHGEGEGAGIDRPRLAELTRAAIRFLDDVVEVTRDPLPEIAATSRGNRKVGLGVMGFAECLIRLGFAYGSPEAIGWADGLMAFIAREAREASRGLAEERGSFPNWARSVHAASGVPMRNATCLSIAPTGTLSILAGTSGGIEPLFALAYRRSHTLDGEPMVEINPVFLREAEARGLSRDAWLPALLERGTLRGVAGLPEDLARRFVTATELAPREHLLVQAAFQRRVDNAVSKTINLPEDAAPADVREAYVEAWRLGLKGTTVYRSGSRDRQVLTLGAGEDAVARELYVHCDPGACRL